MVLCDFVQIRKRKGERGNEETSGKSESRAHVD